METETIIIVSAFSVGWLVLLIVALVLCLQVSSLRKKLIELQGTSRVRVQKLAMEGEAKNHAFQSPAIAPDEELSKRGYSMYMGNSNEDVESNRGNERQTGGQFVDELARELETRHQRQTAPPFLLQSIEENKRKTRELSNPIANQNHQNHSNHNNHSNQNNHPSHGRQSGANPNFIY